MNSYDRTMRYEKASVLDRLRDNRERHGEKVRRAQEVYHEVVVKELEGRLEQAREGKPVDPAFLSRFPIPQDYTREYDRVIDRFETSTDSTVDLTDVEFNQWMRDEWDWQQRFAASSAVYLAD